MVKVTIGIEENQEMAHWLAVEIEGPEEISVEAVAEELRTLVIKWANTWLSYPNAEVTIKNKQI